MSVEELETVDKPDDSLDEAFVRKVFYISLNSGKILLESGAETYRIEDTMIRIANNYGIDNVQVFVTTTVIILSMNDYALSQTIRIDERANNLEKVVSINELSRSITKGLPLNEAIDRIENIHETKMFPFWLVVFTGGVVAIMFLLLFNGQPVDIPVAAAGGMAGVLITESIQRYTKIKFFNEFFAALFIAVISVLYVEFGPGIQLETIIIAAVMPLVPGVLITNAIREMIRGHLMAGTMKGAEASLTAIAIGAVVGLVFMVMLEGNNAVCRSIYTEFLRCCRIWNTVQCTEPDDFCRRPKRCLRLAGILCCYRIRHRAGDRIIFRCHRADDAVNCELQKTESADNYIYYLRNHSACTWRSGLQCDAQRRFAELRYGPGLRISSCTRIDGDCHGYYFN